MRLIAPLDGSLSYRIDRPKPNSWDPTLFFGQPTGDSEWAWEDLLGGTCCSVLLSQIILIIPARGYQISVEEARKLQINDSIKLEPGMNYATLLGVTHNLHCLVSDLNSALFALVPDKSFRGVSVRLYTQSITTRTEQRNSGRQIGDTMVSCLKPYHELLLTAFKCIAWKQSGSQ